MFAAHVLALCLAAPPADTVNLQWKLKEGDVFFNKTSVDMDQKVEVMGQKIDQKVTMKTVMKFKVKSAKEGATVVDMTILEYKMDATGLPGLNVAEKLKGVTFTTTLNEKMEVTKLEGYDKFIEAVGGESEEQKNLMKAVLPEAAFKQMMSQTFVIGPGKPVAPGDSWKRKTAMAMGPIGNVEVDESFKLEAVKGDVATISEKADMKFKAGDADGGLPFKITKADLKADKFNATHKFDTKLGRMTESRVDMEMSGDMTISVAGNSIDAKLSQKMKTTTEITDKNPIVD